MITKEENRFSLPKEQLAAFCRKHYIKKLSLFGSILLMVFDLTAILIFWLNSKKVKLQDFDC